MTMKIVHTSQSKANAKSYSPDVGFVSVNNAGDGGRVTEDSQNDVAYSCKARIKTISCLFL